MSREGRENNSDVKAFGAQKPARKKDFCHLPYDSDSGEACADACQRLDCLIVGGGPAGLTAAIYLARFHLSVQVIDAGQSRAALIPIARNHAGFPDGVSGVDLLARMRLQATAYGAAIHDGVVERLSREGDHFIALAGDRRYRARTILLATGVVNRRPPMMDPASHDGAVSAGLLRYCPVCDGFEVTDRAIAVLGTGGRGCAEAMFLRSYSRNITLVSAAGPHELDDSQRATLQDSDIRIVGICDAISFAQDKVILEIEGKTHHFDTMYPALGSDVRSELAVALGASRSSEGCLLVDTHQRTNVTGLYAAGDVVIGLDQISHAMGEGGVAATTIRNDLAAATPLRR